MDILSHRLKPTQNKHSARIAIVCDYASAAECHDGVPLSGLEAGQFNRLISAIRLPRHEIYLTWALKSQQTKQSMSSVYSTKGFKHTDFYILQQELIDELAEISTDVIILMGEFASLLLLDNLKYVETKKHRGSAFKASAFPHLAKLSGKVICITNHPRDLMYGGDPKVFYIIMNDLQKFQTLIGNHSLLDHNMTIHTAPTFEEVIHFYNRVTGCDETAFDIEATPKHMTCFSLTCGKNEAMSIPLMDNKGNYWTPEQEIVILDGLANILGDPLIKKIAQNGMFDFMYVLRTLNIVTRNFWFDTMLAQHLCWTDLPKGLDFLTSIYTYFPYHKDEGKSTHLKYIKDWPGYWTYNAKDSITTHHLVEPLQKEIDDLKCQDTADYQMELHKPLMEMEYRGFYADRPNIIKTKHKLEKHISVLQKALNKLAGKELNTNSPKQMVGYFYGELMIKPYINRTTGNATADAVALSRIAKKKTKGSGEARIILKMRTLGKLSSTYFNTPLDDDSRLRCAHKIAGTDSGRLSTERTFFDTGANLQNQPPIFRKYLLADKGKYILEFDKARAEAHVVAFLCQDANMIEAFESGIDVHTFNASNIFEVPMDQVTKHQRSMGKKVVHASNYKMGPKTFSDNLAKDGTFISEKECKILLNAYAKRFPGLARWHREIEETVTKTRMLYNLFGRPKRYLGMIDGNLVRSACSYIPQSTVAEGLNRGMISIYNDPWFLENQIEFLVTVHDSVGFQVNIKDSDNLNLLQELCDRVDKHMYHKFTYKGRSFAIGLDAKISNTSWGNMHELKDFTPETLSAGLNKLNIPL